jgi:hypothetical protein
MKRTTLYLENTTVAPERTAAQICEELIKAGAVQIAATYDAGRIVGLRWIFRIAGQDLLFAMPVRVEQIYRLLRKNNRGAWNPDVENKLREKSERIAWRQLLRWVQIQNAMIQTGMAEAAEIYLPYLEVRGTTLYRAFAEQQFKMLPSPKAEAAR